MKIHVEQLPCSVGEFHAKLLAYMLARVKHRLTENIPAPFPELEILRVIAERIEAGESFEVEFDPPPSAPEQRSKTIAEVAREEYDAECFREAVNKEKAALRAADGKAIAAIPAKIVSLLDYIA